MVQQIKDAIIETLIRADKALSYCRDQDYSDLAMYQPGEVHDGFCEGFGHTSLMEIIEPLMAFWTPEVQAALDASIKPRETELYAGFIKQAIEAPINVQDSHLPHLTQTEWDSHRQLLKDNLPGYQRDWTELNNRDFESVLKRDFDKWNSQKGT